MPLCFIAILSPELLKEQIRKLKEEIKMKYGAGRALRLPAHITLQPPFKIEEALVPQLHVDLAKFTDSQKPFEVHLEGFGAFPPKVLFIDVTSPDPLRKVHRQLTCLLQKEHYITEEVPREFHPHITLATRDLKKSDFRSARESLEKRSFKTYFIATGIHLFQHNGKSWDINREFKFGQ